MRNICKFDERKPVIYHWRFAFLTAVFLALSAMMPVRVQAAPLAGSTIGNAASATYTDASAIPRTATSNTVNTIVQQVAAPMVSAPQSKIVAPGGTVYFPQTLTNAGNGTDTIGLNAADANSGNVSYTSLVMYPDVNGDGVPDSLIPITSSGPLAAGGVFKFVVAATIGAQNNGDTDTITVTATSGFTPAVTSVITDTLTVSSAAVISATKSLSAPSGAAGSGPYTVTLTYTNTGNSTATNIALFDALPTGMTYVANSGRWSGSGATVLTDGLGVAEVAPALGNIVYDTTGGPPQTVYARIASVAPGVSGTLTFQVAIAPGTLAGTLNNTAKWCYNNGVGVAIPAGCDPLTAPSVNTNGTPTNTAPFVVNQIAAVVISDTGVADAPLGQSDSDLTVNGVSSVASATQGATISFKNVIRNNGNFADAFTIATSGSNFPPGTTFQLFQSDGVTPLVGATPAVAPNGGTYNVFVKAILPIGAPIVAGPYNATVTATSVFDPTKTGTVTNRLLAITASTVDLRNNPANTLGTGPGPEATAVVTNTVLPGATTTFTLKVNNTSALADNYDLAASTTGSPFAPGTLPIGSTVVFKADGGVGDCSTTGATLTNTGTIAASSLATICAQVSVPANAAAGTVSVFFRALSPTTGATDIAHNAMTVQTVRSLTLTPPAQSAQIFPSGSTVYTHVITNAGNVTEGATLGQVVLTLPFTGSTAGWSSITYWDKNNDGALDAADPIVTDLSQLTGGTGGASTAAGLDPAESARMFVKVTAPATAIGDVNTATLTVTTTGQINTVAAPAPVASADQTTIIGGQVSLTKKQALDAACDGTADGAFTVANVTTGAVPGACIRYEITATNVGTTAVTTLVISDATPADTTYHITIAAAVTPAGPVVTAPAGGAPGTVQATIPTLNPGATVVLTFGVRIDP